MHEAVLPDTQRNKTRRVNVGTMDGVARTQTKLLKSKNGCTSTSRSNVTRTGSPEHRLDGETQQTGLPRALGEDTTLAKVR